MEAGGKDCEEETLQTAFKKLRVDAESVPRPVSVSEALAPRATPRPCPDSNGAKPKLSCPKDNWHGCMRKASRGASRTQRRRRSKSPILHPPKFTYCSTAAASALSTSSGSLKQQRLAVPEAAEPRPGLDGKPEQKERLAPGSPGHISPLVFGSCTGYEPHAVGATASSAASPELPAVVSTAATQGGGNAGEPGEEEKSACDGAGAGAPPRPRPAEAADFSALSKLHGAAPRAPCSCASDSAEESGPAADTRCCCQLQPQGWNGVEVYSFTGLRDVITECERTQVNPDGATRTLSANSSAAAAAAAAAGSPRSCSEQARVYVDDITIEDLSGYMEFYLYIPKMSHMTEMMYT